jgi:hypothetical protein
MWVHIFQFVLSILFHHITIMYKTFAVLKAYNMSCPNNTSLNFLKSRLTHIRTITIQTCFSLNRNLIQSSGQFLSRETMNQDMLSYCTTKYNTPLLMLL